MNELQKADGRSQHPRVGNLGPLAKTTRLGIGASFTSIGRQDTKVITTEKAKQNAIQHRQVALTVR